MAFSIETLRECSGGFRCALFDFDGTISLIREGWQDVMIPYFCEVVASLGTNEPDAAVHAEVKEFVDRLTGKQTIYQCMALCEAIARRGFAPAPPGEYKKEYLRRLSEKTASRIRGLSTGAVSPETLAVKGALTFVRRLAETGITCYLASGTDEPDVIREATLLGIADVFRGGIYGAIDAKTDCSKEDVIRRLIKEEGLRPEELLGFGDGFVEIQLVSDCGGYAVGVAADEKRGDGIDENKRKRLIGAGAGMIVPHFENAELLLRSLKLV